MSATEERVVRMRFDNAQFKKAAVDTQTQLTDIDKAVNSTGKGRGLLNMASHMDTVRVKASAMQIAAVTAISNIANRAVNAGISLAKSMTLDPIREGFREYESLLTKQNVIMNATGKSAGTVKAILNELNEYSDQTIYSFGNMTDSITKFVNAGIDLPTAVVSIKGIANAAAFAGASAEEANRAMYAFSQSMSLGFIGLQDWNQIETANMGTVKFKQSLIDAGVAAGTLTKQGDKYITTSGKSISATEGWRDGLKEQWATTEVLNKALGKYADTSTKLGKQAFDSATKVRTFTAFMDTLKESMGSGWSAIFTSLIGGVGKSTKMWTGLSETVSGSVDSFFKFSNAMVKTWRNMGGLEKTLQGFKNLFAPLVALFGAVGDAWAQVFPSTGKGSGETLYKISSGFEAMTRPLQTLAKWIPKITPVIAGFFRIIKAGLGGIGEFTSHMGELLGNFEALSSFKFSDGYSSFFKGIGDALSGALSSFVDWGKEASAKVVDGLKAGFTNGSLNTVANIAGAGLLGGIFVVIRKIMKDGIGVDLTGGITESITDTFGALTDTLSAMQQNIKAKTLMSIAAAVALLAGSMVALSFVKGENLAKSLTAMASGLALLMGSMLLLTKMAGKGGFIKLPIIASGLVLIAAAVLTLSLAMLALSLLSWEDVGKGLATISAMITGIALAMKLMPKSLPLTAAGLVLVGAAVLAISGAIMMLSLISWEGLAKGVVALSLAIAGIALAMKLMPKSLPLTAAGLVLVGVGLNAIATAVAIFSTMSWEELAKGLIGVSLAIAGIALAMKLMPKSLPLTAVGLVLVGVALNGIAIALKSMGSMSWEEIARGLVALGGSMAILAAGLNFMKGTLLGSASLLIAAGAIMILTPALRSLGEMSWEEIAKAMVGLAGGLTILGVAAALMGNPVVLAGAAAMLLMAPAIMALSMALKMLGSLSWKALAIALVGLAAGLTIVGVAGYLLAPLVPVFLGFGAAMGLFGAGLLMAAKAVAIFVSSIDEFITIGKNIIGGLIAGLAAGGSKIWSFLSGIFGKVIDFVKNIFGIRSPSTVFSGIGRDIIQGLINGIRSAAGAVWGFLSGVFSGAIEGARNKVSEWLQIGVSLVTKVVEGIATLKDNIKTKIGDLIQGGIDWAKDKVSDFKSIGRDVVQGIIDGVGEMFDNAMSAIGNLASGMVNKAKGILDIFSPSRVFQEIGKFVAQGMTKGVRDHAAAAIVATGSMVSGQIAVASEYISRFVQNLDQQAIKAGAKAAGVAKEAQLAAKAAERAHQRAEKAEKAAAKTKKNKKDDKAARAKGRKADKLDDRAENIARKAERYETKALRAEERAEEARQKAARAEEFEGASLIEKAEMRSEDAQGQMDAAKDAERLAAAKLAQAAALREEAKAKGVSKKDAKAMKKEADRLEKQAKAQAAEANAQIELARQSAVDAMALQKQAGDEAAALFQARFDAEAKEDADAEAFEKLSDAEKAAERRRQADALQAKANADLQEAKTLAYTDLEAANELADQAMDQAEQARQYLLEAADFEKAAAQGTGISAAETGGTVVNLDPTAAASIAFNKYASRYDAGVAAAAGTRTVEFNQYNTSPEALSPAEVYRRTNNLLDHAANKVAPSAA